WSDTDGKVDIFVAAIGTGGTISGTAKYLKEQNHDIKVIGVEPESSPLLTKGVAGAHKIQGIGANFVPDTLNRSFIDEIVTVSDDSAYEYTRLVAKSEGCLVGISSGAALAAACNIALRAENKGKNIVVILPDSGSRYLSSGVFE
ncbi:MAG: pyridoxal-phosphate dependent enzyme, partial [Acutalibacteraceae bacterium]|nr:pyridoxal-phosphate dependent enzyme [Acutalibacteraceae bacterium]